MKRTFAIAQGCPSMPQRTSAAALSYCVCAIVLLGVMKSPSDAFGAPPDSSEVRLVLLDGQTISSKSLVIQEGKLSGGGVPDGLTLDDLRRIEAAELMPRAGDEFPVLVELRGEGSLLATSVTVANDQCRIAWSHGEPLSVSVDSVRAVRFERTVANADFDKAVATPLADLDRLFLKVDGGKLESVTGLIDSLSEDEVTFELEGQTQQVARSKLFGLVIAQPEANDSPAAAILILRDGSQLGGELVSLTGRKAQMQLAGGGKAEVPWSAIAQVLIRSSRVAFLSDLKPLAVNEQPVVTVARPWRKDKSVAGNPLTLGTRVFDKGIGVHARSSLTFATEGKYDFLAATIGIDAETSGKGDCIFTVQGDGQPLFSQRVQATDPPLEIKVPVRGVAEVTLLVEPGANLDLADHADWAEVRFIRDRDKN